SSGISLGSKKFARLIFYVRIAGREDPLLDHGGRGRRIIRQRGFIDSRVAVGLRWIEAPYCFLAADVIKQAGCAVGRIAFGEAPVVVDGDSPTRRVGREGNSCREGKHEDEGEWE